MEPGIAGKEKVRVAASAPSAGPPPPAPTEPEDAGDFPARVAAYERKLLGEALAASHFNQRRAALALGLTYDQLRHHLKKHALIARGRAQ
jgi:psp operon transcriptional activator